MMKMKKRFALAVLLVGAVQTMQAAYQVGLGSDRFIGSKSVNFNDLPLRSAGKSPFFCDDARFQPVLNIDEMVISSFNNLMSTCWDGVFIRDNNRFLYCFNEFEQVIELPFEYHQLSRKDFSQTYYGYQNCAFIIKGDECALVGPLCPCIGIFVTRTDCSETLVMHVDQNVSFITIRDEIDSFVTGINRESIKVSIYTRLHEGLGGKSNKMIALVSSHLCNALCINKVTTTVWEKDDVMRLRDKGICSKTFFPPYYAATCGVFVTSKGGLFTTCLQTEVVKLFEDAKDGFFLGESFFKYGVPAVTHMQSFCADNHYDQYNYNFVGCKILVKNLALECHQASDDTK